MDIQLACIAVPFKRSLKLKKSEIEDKLQSTCHQQVGSNPALNIQMDNVCQICMKKPHPSTQADGHLFSLHYCAL
jgi:spore coat protein CotF